MPRLGSDVVGGKSGRNQPTSRRHPIHVGRIECAHCVHSHRLVRGSRTILYDSLVGMVKESYLLQLSVALYTFGSRSKISLVTTLKISHVTTLSRVQNNQVDWKHEDVPCNLETLRSLQTACHAVCRLRGHRFNELHARVCFGEITSKKTERIVMIL